MSERSPEVSGVSYEINSQAEGLEKKQEKAKEALSDSDTSLQFNSPQYVASQVPTSMPVQGSDHAISAVMGDDQSSAGSAMSSSGVDNEVPEKEWVDKTKDIMLKTRDDPHLQKNEVSKVKAEYLKARFNKNLILNETG